MSIKHKREGGLLVVTAFGRWDEGANIPEKMGNRDYREIQRRAALPAEDPEHIDILPADPLPPPPTPAEKLAAWKNDPVNAAMLRLIATDSGRTARQIDDAIKANL